MGTGVCSCHVRVPKTVKLRETFRSLQSWVCVPEISTRLELAIMSETLLLPKSVRFLPGLDADPRPGTSLVHIPAIPQTNRRIDLETTPGRCGNLDYCSLGMQRRLVRVPVSRPFVCPECGGKLRPPGQGRRTQARLVPMVRLGVLVGGMGAALVLGYMAGQAQSSVIHAVGRAGQVAETRLAAARTAIIPPAPPAAPAPARIGPDLAKSAAEPALPTIVAFRSLPAHAKPADLVSPPARLMHEYRTGQVVVDCTLAALVTQPVCKVATTRGSDAFSAAALAWLQQLRVQYAPNPDSRSPVLPDHRWRLVVEDFSGQEKRVTP